MRLALAQAELAAACGEVPVGAVLVLTDGQVFASHNHPIAAHDPSAHAEVRVIRQACKQIKNYRLTGARLYVTLEPCIMCAGLLLNSRVQQLYYGASEPKTGAVDSLYQVLCDQRLNHQLIVEKGLLADESSALLKHFFRQRRNKKKAPPKGCLVESYSKLTDR